VAERETTKRCDTELYAVGGSAYAFTRKPLAPTSSQGTVGMISMVIGIAVIALGAHLLSDAGVAQDSIGAQWIVPTVR
jgi:hypothetical protein